MNPIGKRYVIVGASAAGMAAAQTTRDNDPFGTIYRKLVFSAEGDRLIGALFVGDITNAGLYRLVIRERMAVDGIKRRLIHHKRHYGHLLCRHTP